jgi:hypothetical protein
VHLVVEMHRAVFVYQFIEKHRIRSLGH